MKARLVVLSIVGAFALGWFLLLSRPRAVSSETPPPALLPSERENSRIVPKAAVHPRERVATSPTPAEKNHVDTKANSTKAAKNPNKDEKKEKRPPQKLKESELQVIEASIIYAQRQDRRAAKIESEQNPSHRVGALAESHLLIGDIYQRAGSRLRRALVKIGPTIHSARLIELRQRALDAFDRSGKAYRNAAEIYEELGQSVKTAEAFEHAALAHEAAAELPGQ